MRDTPHKPAQECDACAAAERNPLSGLYRTGCEACWARHVAALPTREQRAVFWAMDDAAERDEFKRRVQAAWDRAHGVCAAEGTGNAQ